MLQKLSKAVKVLYNNRIEEMIKSSFIYELCCAYKKAEEIGRDVLIWPDIGPDTKDRLGLPQEDVGIDYMDKECTFAGQAKLYDKTRYVKACDIDRTRLCAYRARKYSGKDIFPNVEITTPENIKLGRCKM